MKWASHLRDLLWEMSWHHTTG